MYEKYIPGMQKSTKHDIFFLLNFILMEFMWSSGISTVCHCLHVYCTLGRARSGVSTMDCSVHRVIIWPVEIGRNRCPLGKNGKVGTVDKRRLHSVPHTANQLTIQTGTSPVSCYKIYIFSLISPALRI